MGNPPTVAQLVAARKQGAIAMADMRSGVRDTGRRGNPKLGCDCVQCFGYCTYDADTAGRQLDEKGLNRET